MSGLIAAAVGGIWLAVRMIINPGSISWLHWIVPSWEQRPLTQKILHTLQEIQAEAKAAGLTVGEPVHFSTFPGFSKQAAGFNDFLVPLYAEATCQAADRSLQACPMVELRVYRPPTETLRLPGQAITFELIDRLIVTGPEELAAIAPLVDTDLASSGSTRRLPLRTITVLPGQAPLPGIWLHLSGEWQRGSSRVLYGQVVRYDPTQEHIQALLAWTSPAQQFPRWQQVTGGESTELLVDQTIGLEPQFQVYQFAALTSPGKPIQVKAIDLKAASLKTRSYVDGLLLARHGLWSAALQLLQTAKRTDPDWSTLAQSQLDLVALHANVTQSQAQREWNNPRSQIMALLIDGRWSDAFNVLRSAHANGYTTSTLLANPSDRLWRRVEAAMRVNASSDLLNWGVLLTAIRQDRAAALAWLQTHNTGSDRPVETVLALLDPLPITTVTSTSLSPSPTSSAATTTEETIAAVPVSVDTVSAAATVGSTRRLIGTARLQPTINPVDWLLPDPTQALVAEANQVWYEIDTIGFQDGSQWQLLNVPALELPSDATLAAQLWAQMGLDTQPTLQLISWAKFAQPQIREATVKAVRVVDNKLVLLAVGNPPPANAPLSPSLAITLATISWMEPIGNLTLADLSQQPAWSETLVPMLWQELQHTQQLLPLALTDPATLLQQVGGWSVQLIELTGDGQPEAILSLQVKPAADTGAVQAQPHTLILSNQGYVLFRDRGIATEPSLKAIVDLGDGPALIVGDAQGYWVKRWSEQTQQFQAQSFH
jgi:hypothetical protein